MKSNNDILFDLLYIFKKLYEKDKITRNEYTKAIQKVLQKEYKI